MRTLTEIETAADQLPPEEKQELILFLATRLRATGADLPPPRSFNKEQITRWIAEDEEGYTEQFCKIAGKHGVSLSAVEQLYDALRSTGGGMAQFSHPDLGGYGQWMRGGMIMVGDMFNHGLKAKVNALCMELSALAASSGDAPVDRPDANFFASRKNWWPSEFGSPSSTGGQNQLSYAYFPQSHRVAVRDGETITLFDATGHEVHGFSQQQQNDLQGLHLSSNRGLIPVLSLPRVNARR